MDMNINIDFLARAVLEAIRKEKEDEKGNKRNVDGSGTRAVNGNNRVK